VVDTNGEVLQEVMIEHITNDEVGEVTLLKNTRHDFQDGDKVRLHAIEGMDGINDTVHTVTVINPQTFKIGDTSGLAPYVRGGLGKQVKQEAKVDFKSLAEHLMEPVYDMDMYISDFEKMYEWPLMHVAFQALDRFSHANGRLPEGWSEPDAASFVELASEMLSTVEVERNEDTDKYLKNFSRVCEGVFSPLTAFLGGIVA
jgi:ubiquitin-activating enzyme E1